MVAHRMLSTARNELRQVLDLIFLRDFQSRYIAVCPAKASVLLSQSSTRRAVVSVVRLAGSGSQKRTTSDIDTHLARPACMCSVVLARQQPTRLLRAQKPFRVTISFKRNRGPEFASFIHCGVLLLCCCPSCAVVRTYHRRRKRRFFFLASCVSP